MKNKYCFMQIAGIFLVILLTVMGCSSNRYNSMRPNESPGQYIVDSGSNDHKTNTSILAVSERISNEIYADLERAYRKDTGARFSQADIIMDLSAHPLTIMTFTDLNRFQTSVDFGRAITECLITSFEQKGFGVIELRKTNEIHIEKRNGEYFLSRDVKEINQNLQFSRVLVGTYSIEYDTVIVNARLMEVSSGRIIASVSLEMGIDENIWFLLTNGGTLAEMVKKLPFDFVDNSYFQKIGVNGFERKPKKL